MTQSSVVEIKGGDKNPKLLASAELPTRFITYARPCDQNMMHSDFSLSQFD